METQKKTENLLLIVLGVLVILALLLIALNNNSNLFSKYSSYDDCFINEMSKMPEGLEGERGMYSLQQQFRNSVRRLCLDQFPD